MENSRANPEYLPGMGHRAAALEYPRMVEVNKWVHQYLSKVNSAN